MSDGQSSQAFARNAAMSFGAHIVKPVFVFAIVASLFAASTGQSVAASAMAYSELDGSWGWTVNYESRARAESAAENYCAEFGGTDCQTVLDCVDGFGAVATPGDGKSGIAMVCGADRSRFARMWALAQCGVAANTLCWTATSFNLSGSQNSTEENLQFDLAFYAQRLLATLGYDPGPADGDIGPKTRFAFRSFQDDLGLEEVGEIDRDSIYLMLGLTGGVQIFVASMKADLIDPEKDRYDSRTYVYSKMPRPAKTYPELIAAESTMQRRLILAALLTRWGTPCAIPAKKTQIVGNPADGSWTVGCVEGEYSVVFDEKSHTVTMSAGGDEDADSPTSKSKDAPDTNDDPGTTSKEKDKG